MQPLLPVADPDVSSRLAVTPLSGTPSETPEPRTQLVPSSGTEPPVDRDDAELPQAAIIGLIVWLVSRRNRKRALVAWRSGAESALDSANLARTLLPAAGQDVPDSAHWQAVHERVETAAQSLDQSAGRAPTPEGAQASRTAADKLRGLWFALESDRLLREGTTPPTPEQLAQADTVTRARGSELDTALADLERIVRPPQTGGTP